MVSGCCRVVFSSALIITAPVWSAPTTLTATGTVTSISTQINSQPAANPLGAIKVGDSYSVTATFDLSLAQLGSLYDADPTINIYNLPNTTVSYTIGSFSHTVLPQTFNSSIQLWDNFTGYGLSPTDAQVFSFFDYPIDDGSVPFGIGSGTQALSLDLDLFDNSALARTNDTLTQIVPFSSFSSRLFSLGQLNQSTSTFVYVNGTIDSETLAAVPEPSTWGMMITGLGIVGSNIRLRRRRANALLA